MTELILSYVQSRRKGYVLLLAAHSNDSRQIVLLGPKRTMGHQTKKYMKTVCTFST